MATIGNSAAGAAEAGAFNARPDSNEWAAAHAQAERAISGLRFHAPVSRRGRLGPGAAAAAVLVAFASIGWWLVAGADAPVTSPVAGEPPARLLQALAPAAETTAVSDAVAVAAAAQAVTAERTACAGADCLPRSAADPQLAETPRGPADPDAWALHPEPGPVNPTGGFKGKVNTPEVPDEFDATPGEDTPPDGDASAQPEPE